MSLFELEKILSFDEFIGSFDTERVEKVRGFVDWLAQYSGSLVHNPWGEVNPDLEIVTKGFDAAQVRRDNLVAYLLPRLGRAKVFVVAEAVGYQGGRFTGIAITCERMLLDKHKTIRAKDVTLIILLAGCHTHTIPDQMPMHMFPVSMNCIHRLIIMGIFQRNLPHYR